MPLIFEYPLSERTRLLLRLEHVFNELRARLAQGTNSTISRTVLDSYLDLVGLLERSDLKRELLAELERQRVALRALIGRPEVESKRLESALNDLKIQQRRLEANQGQLGTELKSNDLLTMVRSRHTIPGGTCNFDIPALHYWLTCTDEHREKDLRRWLETLEPVEEAVRLTLRHLRQSGPFQPVNVGDGTFQWSPDPDNPPALLRLQLEKDKALLPKISAGRHRVTVNFLRFTGSDDRPKQMRDPVIFDFAICKI